MFDFHKILERYTDRTFRHIYDITEKKGIVLGVKFEKVLRFIGYKVLPFLFGATTYITMFWFVKLMYGRLGFDYVIMFLLVAILLKSPKQ